MIGWVFVWQLDEFGWAWIVVAFPCECGCGLSMCVLLCV